LNAYILLDTENAELFPCLSQRVPDSGTLLNNLQWPDGLVRDHGWNGWSSSSNCLVLLPDRICWLGDRPGSAVHREPRRQERM